MKHGSYGQGKSGKIRGAEKVIHPKSGKTPMVGEFKSKKLVQIFLAHFACRLSVPPLLNLFCHPCF